MPRWECVLRTAIRYAGSQGIVHRSRRSIIGGIAVFDDEAGFEMVDFVGQPGSGNRAENFVEVLLAARRRSLHPFQIAAPSTATAHQVPTTRLRRLGAANQANAAQKTLLTFNKTRATITSRVRTTCSDTKGAPKMPTTYYDWDPITDSILEETDENGEVTATYINGPDGRLIAEFRGDKTLYHEYDAIGDTRQLSDENGTIADTFTYDAWGNSVDHAGDTETPFQWLGEWGYYYDNELGHYQVRRRSLDPVTTRWTSPDPLGLTDGTNSYAYAHNTPLLLIDPSGLRCIVCSWSLLQGNEDLTELDAETKGTPYTDAAIAYEKLIQRQIAPFGAQLSAVSTTKLGLFSRYNPKPFKIGPVPFDIGEYRVPTRSFVIQADVCEGAPGDCVVRFSEDQYKSTADLRAAWNPKAEYSKVDKTASPIAKSPGPGAPIMISDLKKPANPKCNKRIVIFDSPFAQSLMFSGGYVTKLRVQQRNFIFDKMSAPAEDVIGGKAPAAGQYFNLEFVIGLDPQTEPRTGRIIATSGVIWKLYGVNSQAGNPDDCC